MNLTNNIQIGSTAYTKINNVLSQYEWYNDYRAMQVNREHYWNTLMQFKPELLKSGLSEDQIHLSSRFSLNAEETVRHILHDLLKQNMIDSIDYPKDEFAVLTEVIAKNFCHGKYMTYIFPEEARLLYALTYIMKPKTMLFLGSYYGYWAIWAIMLLKKMGGKAYLIDIDDSVINLARENMEKFELESVVTLVNEDALEFIAREKIQHDFMVVDPEGPKKGPDPDLLDKAIYYPMVKAAHPYLSTKGIIICHNILLNNPIKEDGYFHDKIKYNKDQFIKFLPFMSENYASGVWYNTTEGVGIFCNKKAGR